MMNAERRMMNERRVLSNSSFVIPHSSFFQYFPRNDDALNLARPFVDGGDAGVAVHALDRVVARVAIAAMNLDGVGADAVSGFRGVELRYRSVEASLFVSGVFHRGGAQREQTRGVGFGRHVSQLELNRLELGDRLAEGVPL